MPGRTISIEITATDARASAVFDHFAAKSQSTATTASGHFDVATSKIGGAFKALDSQLGSFGIPFTGALTKIGSSLDAAKQQGQGFLGTITAIGGAETVAAGVALAVVGSASVKMAQDFEASHAQLSQAAANVGASLSGYAGQISKTDSQLEKLGFTNAETEGALSRLVTATHNVAQSTQLMGLAADIARARNLSLHDATDILTKAEQGRYLQLTRLGIISKQQAAEFHSTADAINYLTKAYGGQAQAYAETFAGKLSTLKAEAVDLGVNIGEALIPKIEALVSTASTIVSGFESANHATGGFLGELALTAAVAPIAIAAYGKLQAGAAAIDGALSGLSIAIRGTTAANAEQVVSNEALAASYVGVEATQLSMLDSNGAVLASAAAVESGQLALFGTNVGVAESNATVAGSNAAVAESEVARATATDSATASNEALTASNATGAASAGGLVSSLVRVAGVAAIVVGAMKLVGSEVEHFTTSSPNVDKLSLGLQQIGQGAEVSNVDVAKLRGQVQQLGEDIKRAQASGDITTVDKLTAQSASLTGQIYTLDQLGGQYKKLAADIKEAKSEREGLDVPVLGQIGRGAETIGRFFVGDSQSVQNIHAMQNALLDLYKTDPGSAITAFDRLKSTLVGGTTSAQDVDRAFGKFEKTAGLLGSLLSPTSQAQKDLNEATAQYARDLEDSHTPASQLAADHEKVAQAAAAMRVQTRAAADAQNDFNDASQRLSAAQKTLKQDLDQNIGEPSKLADDFKNLKQAVLDAASIDRQVADAMRADQAAAEVLSGGIINLASAYELLGQSQAQENAQSLANINKAADSQTVAILAQDSAQDQYNKSLVTLTKNQDDSNNAGKTAIAIEIEHEQKVLAVRDAQKALGDQAEKVATAESNIAKAQYDAGNATVALRDAELGLASAQTAAKTAALNAFYAEAQYEQVLHGVSAASQQAQDAGENLAKARLSVQSSTLDIADAETALARANAIGDPEGIQRAQIALAEVRLRHTDAIKAQTEAQRVNDGTLHGFSKDSKEATDAQRNLTQAQDASTAATRQVDQAQRSLMNAFFGVVNANRSVTDAQRALRDVQDQGATVALNLKRAQADLDGQLQKTSIKQAETYREKLDAVAKSALGVKDAIGQTDAELGKSRNAAILEQIAFLQTAIRQTPDLAKILLPDIAKLLDLLKGTTPPETNPGGFGSTAAQTPVGGPHRLFDMGGWVQAAPGAAVQAVVHGGEYVVSRDELTGRPRSDSPFFEFLRLGGSVPGAPANDTRLTTPWLRKTVGAVPDPTDTQDASGHSQGSRRGHYDVGGWVPGASGVPVPVILHAGEYVVSRDELLGRPRPDSPFFDVLHPAARNDARAGSAVGGATPKTTSTQGFSSVGGQLIGAFADGIHERWAKNVQPFLQSAKENVTGKFSGSDRWLQSHGRNVVDGFYEGLQASWPSVDGFFEFLPGALSSKTGRAVQATAKSWQGIEFAFALPVNWSINNVINKLIDDVNWIAHVVGLGSITSRVPNVPVGSFATGGIVQRDQLARVHAGEGILPAAATAKLSPGTFEALHSGDMISAIFSEMLAGQKTFPAPAIRGTVVGLTNAAAGDVIKYLQAIPVPQAPLPATIGGTGGGAQLFSGPLPSGGDRRVPGHTITQWAHDLLVTMGISPPSDTDIRAMITWANHESGGYNPRAAGGLYNPLNSTEGHYGYVGQGGSQGNIKDYGSYPQGIANLAWNLTHTRGVGYEAIVSALKQGTDERAIFNAIDNSRFGTHGLRDGGITNFPPSGAPAVLHGREAVIPLPQGFDIRELTERTRIPAGAYGHRTTNVTNRFEINVESLDPYTARNLILQSLKEIQRTNGFVPLITAAG